MTVHIDVEPHPQGLVDLASNQAGGALVRHFSRSLELTSENFDSERYTERVMDGWEPTKADAGHDTAALGIAQAARSISIQHISQATIQPSHEYGLVMPPRRTSTHYEPKYNGLS